MKRLAVCAVLLGFAAVPSQAYYFFVHYIGNTPVPEKFDLTALTNNTLSVFVSETGPTNYTSTDTFNSVVNQIVQATAVWNGVATSNLRVNFGGFENAATVQNTPGIDVMFTELPPGVEGLAGPTTYVAASKTDANGAQFFPITRAAMYLNTDMTVAPGPSFDQSFLMTTLHEMGHALGLQHPFTSATMSQATTRATTVTHPIDNDDIAALSTLYPAPAFSQQFGTITGRVTAGGQPVHLASVVAIQPGTGAVSAVTNPDGTFQINGVPAGTYAVYAHTMPPDADILGPWNAAGVAVAANPAAVNTAFYGGTTDMASATPITVTAGQTTNGINIATTSRASVPFYDGQVFGFFGNNDTIETYPAPVQIEPGAFAVASVVGLGTNGSVPGLNVEFSGAGVSAGLVPYAASGNTYVELNLNFAAGFLANPQPGTEHIAFETPDYTYMLPSAMFLTKNPPPTVTAVTANNNGTLTVTGTNFSAGTSIYFDSLPATIVSLNAAASSAVVIPPAGSNGQTATITAYTPDGQNSQILQSASPVTYPYGTLAQPSFALSLASMSAGANGVIDIVGANFSFAAGATTVGFGTSDITVERVFVLAPNHLQADIAISPGAALSVTDVSVVSGFAMATLTGGFQITAQTNGLPAPYPVLFNALPLLTGAYPGAIVSLYGTNLAASGASQSVTIGGQSAAILYASSTQINLIVPPGLAPGLQSLQVFNGLFNSYPLVVNIDTPAAGINAIQTTNGSYIDATQPAFPGETLIVSFANFAPSGATVAPGQVQVNLGGTVYTPTAVQQVPSTNIWLVTFQIGPNQPTTAQEELVVYYNGRSTLPATINVSASPI